MDCADDDCDGQVDGLGNTCEAPDEQTCNDGQDNDGDFQTDCDDANCAGVDGCP